MECITFCNMLTSSLFSQCTTSANRLVKHRRESFLSFWGIGASSIASGEVMAGCAQSDSVMDTSFGWASFTSVSVSVVNGPTEVFNRFSIPTFMCFASFIKSELCFSVEGDNFNVSESMEIETSYEIKNTTM